MLYLVIDVFLLEFLKKLSWPVRLQILTKFNYFHFENLIKKSFYFQAERYLDRKSQQIEDKLKKSSKKARKWYTNLIGDENGPKINELHIFMFSFVAGMALGVGSA